MTASKRNSTLPLMDQLLAAAWHVAHCGRGSPFCNRHGNTMEAKITTQIGMIRIRTTFTPFGVTAGGRDFVISADAATPSAFRCIFVPLPAPPFWRTALQLLSARLAILGTVGRTSLPPMAMTASKRNSTLPLMDQLLAAAWHVAHSGRGSPFCNRHGNTMEAEQIDFNSLSLTAHKIHQRPGTAQRSSPVKKTSSRRFLWFFAVRCYQALDSLLLLRHSRRQ